MWLAADFARDSVDTSLPYCIISYRLYTGNASSGCQGYEEVFLWVQKWEPRGSAF